MIKMKNTPFDIPIFDLTGKVAVITGNTTGLGYGMAVAFCAYRAKVVINGLNEEDCRKIPDEIDVMSGTAIPFRADIRNRQEAQAMVAKTAETLGKLGIMICNADIDITRRAVKVSNDEWDEVVNTDLKGVFICGVEAVKVMIEKEIKGKVINISSIGGLAGTKSIAAYCVSKSGVISLSKTGATERGCYGITTSATCPGYVSTAINSAPLVIPKVKEQILAKIALRRLGEVWETAAVALFLAPDTPNIVAGTYIVADIGMACN